MRRAGLLAAGAALVAHAAAAQNVEVVIREEALNRLVDRLRDPSKSGVHQPTLPTTPADTYSNCVYYGVFRCPGTDGTTDSEFAEVPLLRCEKKGGGTSLVPSAEPVGWQWWITGSRFQAKSGELTFTARLQSRIGTRWRTVEKTVPASVGYDPSTNLLNVQVSSFKVPLTYEVNGVPQTIGDVDVGKLSSFAIRVPPQTAQLWVSGGSRTVTAWGAAATPVYEAGRIRMRFDVAFSGANLPPPSPWNVGNPGAEDGRLGISESVLDELAAALGPLTFQDNFSFPLPIPNPFFPLGPPFFFINIPCAASAVVTGLRFDVNPDPTPIAVAGQVSGSVCGLPFGGTVSTTTNVSHHAPSRTLRITTASTTLRPTVLGITAPFTVNVGPSLSVPPIPFRATVLELDTMGGRIQVPLSGEDVALTKRNGFIEVRGNVALR